MFAAGMVRSLITTIVLALVWIAWSWHFEPLVVGFGVVAVVLTVALSKRMNILDEEGEPFEINIRLIRYIPWLVIEVLKANFQVAKLILDPEMPISPRLLKVRANQRTTLGQVIHANTITLTPGTISLDLRDNTILVHALSAEAQHQDESGRVDEMISWLESGLPEGHEE